LLLSETLRDIAARNVLLHTSDLIAKVTDFGMSRQLENSQSSRQKTISLIGPLKWMSPEQLSDQRVSKASDVFSFGVLIYEVFAKELPWKGLTPVSAAQGILEGKTLKLPSTVNKEVSEIVNLCFAFNQKERPRMDDIVLMLNRSVGKQEAGKSGVSSNWKQPPFHEKKVDYTYVKAIVQDGSSYQPYHVECKKVDYTYVKNVVRK